MFASQWKVSLADKANFNSLSYGLSAGLGFALASLWIRSASLSLAVGPIPSAAAVLLYMVVLQSLICFLWIVLKEPEQLNLIKNNFGEEKPLPGNLIKEKIFKGIAVSHGFVIGNCAIKKSSDLSYSKYNIPSFII